LAEKLSMTFLELMASRYDEPQYRSLLKAMTGEDLSKTDRVYALFHRDPDLPQRDFPPLAFKSQRFPAWRIAFLRTGERGMDATVLLGASHWGGHHHYDSLNLTYHRWGEELLGDLGYLWDNPMAMMTRRTLAHNLVTPATWQATWKIADGKTFVAWMLPQSDEKVLIGSGWGQKGGARVTPDPHITLPYVMRRTTGENKLSVFASIFVGEEGAPFVRAVQRVPLNVEGATLLRVETAASVDYIISALNGGAVTTEVDGHRIELNGTLAVVSVREGSLSSYDLFR